MAKRDRFAAIVHELEGNGYERKEERCESGCSAGPTAADRAPALRARHSRRNA